MIERDELVQYINELLAIDLFQDYAPNGLQVQGKKEIKSIAYGVTASLALIDRAIAEKADAIIVHHGLFWKGQDGRVVGWMKERLQKLLVNDINLYAYHLPLDAHPTIGNNAVLGKVLELLPTQFIGEPKIIAIGQPMGGGEVTITELAERIVRVLHREPTVVQGDGRTIKKLGWCTGGAQGYFEEAIAAGVDAYITGEISEAQAHYARETGVAYIAAGHHATERFGIQALAGVIEQNFKVHGKYIEIDNPA